MKARAVPENESKSMRTGSITSNRLSNALPLTTLE